MIEFGVDRILQNAPAWKSHRIGLITNQAATTNTIVPSRKALVDHGFNIVTLFSPEHGLMVDGPDGHPMPNGMDALTGLPVISLYGQKLSPTASDLSNIDILVFDIPDIGCRFYTYLWTLSYLMEAAAFHQIPLVVLDRPNPVSGNLSLAEGPMLAASEASFIGRWNMPVRHSCTLGELAQYFNATRSMSTLLEVVSCKGWDRSDFQPEWGIPFVATSPAIQDFASMLLYPGLCLLEATNISEGRGTHLSFQVAGAPWMNGKQVAKLFNQLVLEDLSALPIEFEPFHSKYANQPCAGIQLQVLEPPFFQSMSYGLLLIKMIKELYPKQFQWSPYPTSVNKDGQRHLNKLLGIPDAEQLFDLPLQSFIAQVSKLTFVADWKEAVAPYLLY
ncbi:MAG: hypothetical protein B7X72_04425 [Sphingobacteriia bacterium 39-39-8]|nr:MAG: hypothetical protein B7X72_04425 [Sphingobacteriia bacterium 39-39-8]HQR93845.1 DUF1343 domain-containing protein [Sediminibacterium sp.]